MVALAPSGCAQLLGLKDPPAQADAGALDARIDGAVDAPLGRCGVAATQIRDPGFVDPMAWQVTGSAVVDPTAVGYMGPGIAAKNVSLVPSEITTLPGAVAPIPTSEAGLSPVNKATRQAGERPYFSTK